MAATLGLATAIRSNRATQILNAMDVTTAGAIRLYDGTQPATGGTATTKLAENALSTTAGTVSSGVLTFNTITDANAVATGTATWSRIVDSTGAFVCDMNAGTSGTAVTLNSASITSGQNVHYTSGSFTEGNA